LFSLSGTAPKKVRNQRNDREQQQQMNQGAGDMKNQEASQPRQQENDEKYDEHLLLPSGSRK
jgi:hypothetical protein